MRFYSRLQTATVNASIDEARQERARRRQETLEEGGEYLSDEDEMLVRAPRDDFLQIPEAILRRDHPAYMTVYQVNLSLFRSEAEQGAKVSSLTTV